MRRRRMRFMLLPAGALMLVTAAAPAIACGAEPVPDAVVFDRPPAQRPPGFAPIKVVARISRDNPGYLSVTLADPVQARRLGTAAWLSADDATTCTGWGRLGAEAYVVARPAGKLRGRTLLRAKVYARSGWDRFWSWFGLPSYTATGPPGRFRGRILDASQTGKD